MYFRSEETGEKVDMKKSQDEVPRCALHIHREMTSFRLLGLQQGRTSHTNPGPVREIPECRVGMHQQKGGTTKRNKGGVSASGRRSERQITAATVTDEQLHEA